MRRRLLRWVLFAGLAAVAAPAVADSCIPMAYWRSSTASDVIRSMVVEMYTTAGLCVRPAKVPLKRAEEMLIKTRNTANIARSEIFIANHREAVVKVPTPLLELLMLLIYDVRVHEPPIDLGALRHMQVGIFMGDHFAADEVERIGAAPFPVNSFETVVRMVMHGRLSLGALPSSAFRAARRTLDAPARIESAPLHPQPYYHVLPKPYAHLAGRLDAALKTVLAKGTFDERFAAAQ